MIDHLTLHVSDIAKARAFYSAALAPLGYSVKAEFPGMLGMMDARGGMSLWISGDAKSTPSVHIAFTAKDRPMVDAFHAAAMAAGAAENGPPGLRPHYHPDYYGAFVLDPDGNNIEAVCHKPA